MEDELYRQVFRVGDVIKPSSVMEKLFLRDYRFEAPFTVTDVFLNHNETQWLLLFKDANGRTPDAGWYHYRFEAVYKGYDPKQQGDTDDDI